MAKKIKGIFTDIDGTLTNENGLIESSILRRFEQLRKNGYKVVCVTGRSDGCSMG